MADQENQVIPLAPARINRSDEEVSTIKPNSLVQQKSSKWLVYILSAIVILSLVMLILGLTLRINSPNVSLRPVDIKNLRYATLPSPPSLDMNMVAEVRIDNTNFGPFKFHNCNSILLYGNVTVGVTNINGGRVNGRDTKNMNITVQVRGNTLLNNNANFSSDIGSRLVPLSSYTKMKGEVQVIKIINSRRTAIMNCTMKLNLTRQAFQDLRCN